MRHHFADIPTEIDVEAHRFTIQGYVERPLTLSLAEFKEALRTVIVAVDQRSSNARGFARPRTDLTRAASRPHSQRTTCPSVDDMAMQPPGKGEALWERAVTKMTKAHRAPIAETQGKAVANRPSARH